MTYLSPGHPGIIDERTGQIIGAGGVPVGTAPQTAAPAVAGTSYTPSTAPGNDGFAAPTGWAAKQGYTPEMLESIYQNPWFVLQDVFKGINTASPGYNVMRDIGADPLSLYSIMEGSNRRTAESSGGAASDFANFLQKLYTQLGTPGGRELNARELLGNIFGQREFGVNAKSDIGALLGEGDPSEQIRTLFNLLRDVAGASMNPLAAAGYQGQLRQAGDMYGNAMLKTGAGQAQNPVEWINQNLPHLAMQRR